MAESLMRDRLHGVISVAGWYLANNDKEIALALEVSTGMLKVFLPCM
jgi:hypothetical protein